MQRVWKRYLYHFLSFLCFLGSVYFWMKNIHVSFQKWKNNWSKIHTPQKRKSDASTSHTSASTGIIAQNSYQYILKQYKVDSSKSQRNISFSFDNTIRFCHGLLFLQVSHIHFWFYSCQQNLQAAETWGGVQHMLHLIQIQIINLLD